MITDDRLFEQIVQLKLTAKQLGLSRFVRRSFILKRSATQKTNFFFLTERASKKALKESQRKKKKVLEYIQKGNGNNFFRLVFLFHTSQS
jgi:hypothetical protein